MKKFNDWWKEIIGDSGQWTSLERMAAKDAWDSSIRSMTIKDHLQAVKDYVDSLDTTKVNCCDDCIIRKLCEVEFDECPAFWDLSEIYE